MADNADDLVERVYAVTVDPESYNQLMQGWESYIEAQAHALETSGRDTAGNHVVERHVELALKIFDQMGRHRRAESSAQAFLAGLPMAAMIVSEGFDVIAANEGAKRLLGAEAGRRLDDLGVDDLSDRKLRSWMAARRAAAEPVLMVPCFLGQQARQSCLAATRIDLSRPLPDVTLRIDVQNGPYFLLTTIDLHFDKTIEEALNRVYRLSAAEASIAIALAEGASPHAIAEQRGVSLHTIRTQIKSALRKLNASAVPELVRIVSGFAATVIASRNLGRAERLGRRRETGALRLRDGRRLFFEEGGAIDGRPVLFIHNMLLGPALTDLAIDVAGDRNWRLIAPSRPGFGQSDPLADPGTTAALDTFTCDIEELLDHLDIDQVALVGHLSGGVHGLRLAKRLPGRVNSLLLVNYVPSYNAQMLMDLPIRQRAFGLTIRYAAHLLPFIARAGVAHIDAGCEDHLLHALHGSIPADMAALARPEVHRVVVEGLRHATQQGPAAFCGDCVLVTTDWSSQARHIRMPAHVLLGAEDRFIRPDYGQDFIKNHPNFELSVVDKAGMYLLYSHWPKVFDVLERITRATREPA
ncbi:MAG: alpha/beta hydrolase, partial [Pseudomonadota bacterium]